MASVLSARSSRSILSTTKTVLTACRCRTVHSQPDLPDTSAARHHCLNLLRKYDTPSYTLQTFLPPSARDAYLALRALNVELARIPDVVSSPTVGALRLQFWRDGIDATLGDRPPREPVLALLHHALASLRARDPGMRSSAMKTWFARMIDARAQGLEGRPYPDMLALETYAENTYASLLYLTLACLPVHSIDADHLASHIGKAQGIVAVLRGMPLEAFPQANRHHSNGAVLSSHARQGSISLPVDVMIANNLKEEDVFRHGGAAPGLRDVVYTVATRANDHLITASSMLARLQKGDAVDHPYEYADEHDYTAPTATGSITSIDLTRAFGVLLSAVPTRLWLRRLERHNFDVFHPRLRSGNWTLPLQAYWAFSRRKL